MFKKLEWEKQDGDFEDRWCAEPIKELTRMRYQVNYEYDKEEGRDIFNSLFIYGYGSGNYTGEGTYTTLDEAKQACQSHFESILREGLELDEMVKVFATMTAMTKLHEGNLDKDVYADILKAEALLTKMEAANEKS
jgi:hypothetical protein